MTFNPDADISGNTTRRRGRNAAIAGGGVGGIGVLGIVALIASQLLGVDLTGLVPSGDGGPGGGAGSSQESTLTECKTGEDANEKVDCRMAGAEVALNAFWEDNVENYVAPGLVVVDGSTPTACGTASNAVGPFYCPPDQTVYIDPTFFDVMRQQFGASADELAQLYIVGHEWGHHIQNIVGYMEKYPNNGTGPASNSVRTELQADCFAGAWIARMSEEEDAKGVPYLEPSTEEQRRDALNAALVVGDDHIQQQSGGFVNPESFTHGTSEQRQYWFANGYQNGLGVCEGIFDLSESELG